MSQQITIPGLIGFTNKIRKALKHGGNPQFTRQESLRMLALVDSHLRRKQLNHNDLTAPARHAYLYLHDLTADSSQQRHPAPKPPPPPGEKLPLLRFPGMQRHLDQLSTALANADPANLSTVGKRIANYSKNIEQTIHRDGIVAQQLSAQARAARAWFAWLAHPERQQHYQRAASNLQTRLSDLAHDAGLGRHPFNVRFRPVSGLYRLSQRTQSYELRLPTAMLTLPDDHLDQLANHALNLSTDKQALITAMEGPAYQAALSELKSLAGEQINGGNGSVHDLDSALQRVREQYFDPDMTLPSIAWSGRCSYRKLGHFDSIANAIVISSALDAPAVPQAALDFVIFHELLHKHHGAQWSGGRARSHTAAFRRDERRYPDKENIEKLLARLSTAQRPAKP